MTTKTKQKSDREVRLESRIEELQAELARMENHLKMAHEERLDLERQLAKVRQDYGELVATLQGIRRSMATFLDQLSRRIP
jgi:predicted  nucleic acid-binding Zn-ribbon protein